MVGPGQGLPGGVDTEQPARGACDGRPREWENALCDEGAVAPQSGSDLRRADAEAEHALVEESDGDMDEDRRSEESNILFSTIEPVRRFDIDVIPFGLATSNDRNYLQVSCDARTISCSYNSCAYRDYLCPSVVSHPPAPTHPSCRLPPL